MTKIRMSPSILEYRQTMAGWVNEARDEKLRIAAIAEMAIEPLSIRKDIPALERAGLLPPPRIELLWPEIYVRDGKTDGLIQINTSDVFGIVDIYLTLRDEAGNLLESGYAMRNEICHGHWGYITSVALTAGTTVIVRAVAMDQLGGVGIQMERTTVQG